MAMTVCTGPVPHNPKVDYSEVDGVPKSGTTSEAVNATGVKITQAQSDASHKSASHPNSTNTSETSAVETKAEEKPSPEAGVVESKAEEEASPEAIVAEKKGEEKVSPGPGDLEAKAEEEASPEPSSPTSPTSPQTTSSQPEKLRRPRYKDERMLNAYISKAHAQVRDGTVVASAPEAREKAMVKYAEMVSQMTHLLHTLGVGRNTTVRALAYLNGPDQPTPQTALRQAQEDRRPQGQKKRVASDGSKASEKDEGQSADNADTKPTSRTIDSDKTVTDESGSVVTNILTRSHQSSLVSAAPTNKSNDENIHPKSTNGEPKTNGTAQSECQDGQKKDTGRRKWWQGKTRHNVKGNKKNKKDQHPNTNGEKAVEEASKVETGEVAGTPDAAVSTAAPMA